MLTGDVGQGGPGDEDGVEGDEGGLQQPRVRLGILQTQRGHSGLIPAQGEVAGPSASQSPRHLTWILGRTDMVETMTQRMRLMLMRTLPSVQPWGLV